MRLVIQRVRSACVFTNGSIVENGEISSGLFVLLGVGEGDSKQKAEKLANKLSKLRVMSDKANKMNLSVQDTDAEILVVSQFTLYADTSKGNRPSFVKAADPKIAEELYEYFISKLSNMGIKTASGSFGEYMEIDAQLDGPVTIVIDE